MPHSAERAVDRFPPASRRAAHRPSLSVILLSTGDRSDLERALVSVAGRCRRMEAEIIVVRSPLGSDATPLSAAYPSVRFLDAGASSTTSEMRERGMTAASGDIVAIRHDGAVGDGAFLEAFDATVGSVGEMDTQEVEVPLFAAIEDGGSVADRRRPADVAVPVAGAGRRRSDAHRTVGLAVGLDFAPSVAHER